MNRKNTLTRATRLLAIAAAAAAAIALTANPAHAQTTGCDPLEGTYPVTCGYVWDDANHNGIQDAGETGLAGIEVFFEDSMGNIFSTYTDVNGYYSISVLDDGTYTVYIPTAEIGTGVVPTIPNVNDATPATDGSTTDSDGIDDTVGDSVATGIVITAGSTVYTDFGFYEGTVQQPGTGTPGYWKNHPEAWPVASITIGGISYTKDEAIAWLNKVSKDKTTTMFAALVSAELNVMIGNTDSCVATTITAADAWMAVHPVGSGVAGSSAAWAEGEPLDQQLDAYNNGLLCAPHRN